VRRGPEIKLHNQPAGIGRATTLALCDRGWRVFAGVLTEGEAQEMRALHAGIEPVLLDVTE
jgi:NAD(P)-dependent dehydrogenase (short-subunit alcohol dehydrogenase family)